MSRSSVSAWSTATIAGAALIASGAFAPTAADSFAPALAEAPGQGKAGASYLVDVFAQTCVSKRNALEQLVHVADVPGWSRSSDKTYYRAMTGRDGWPTISVKSAPNSTDCVVAWTIDPNTGVGSVQAALEKKLGIRIIGQRVNSGPDQTVFTGTDSIGNEMPQIILNENISSKRASFQLTLIGRMSGQ